MKQFLIFIVLFSTINFIMCTHEPRSIQIDADFPGGNIIVDSIYGDTIFLRQDLRDTEGNWFYWSFRIQGAANRTLCFNFSNGAVIGSRGPAISTDEGISWRWIGDLGYSDTKFQYTFGPEENDVYFSQGMNYTEKDLDRFLQKHKDHPDLKLETLCVSKKGREVELVRISNKDKRPDFKIFLSARHHCGEMMASYVLEGIIDMALSNTEEGRWLREHGDFFIVPFVDKDGVEDGDQGKNRRPHDHNRDYKLRIYPEINAITMQVPEWTDNKPVFFLDMHCPWLRGGSDGDHPDKGNEFVFFTGNDPANDTGNFVEKLHRFSSILELSNKGGSIPYRASFNLLYGSSWNTAANRKKPDFQSSKDWGRTLPNAVFASSIEIPFANASGVVVDAETGRELGNNLAIAIKIYLESLKKENELSYFEETEKFSK